MDTHQERVLRRYVELLASDLTPHQAARIAERWELICAEQGWLYLPEHHLPTPPGVLAPKAPARPD